MISYRKKQPLFVLVVDRCLDRVEFPQRPIQVLTFERFHMDHQIEAVPDDKAQDCSCTNQSSRGRWSYRRIAVSDRRHCPFGAAVRFLSDRFGFLYQRSQAVPVIGQFFRHLTGKQRCSIGPAGALDNSKGVGRRAFNLPEDADPAYGIWIKSGQKSLEVRHTSFELLELWLNQSLNFQIVWSESERKQAALISSGSSCCSLHGRYGDYRGEKCGDASDQGLKLGQETAGTCGAGVCRRTKPCPRGLIRNQHGDKDYSATCKNAGDQPRPTQSLFFVVLHRSLSSLVRRIQLACFQPCGRVA